MSLRLRINALITLLMIAFAAVVAKVVIDGARSSIHEEIEAGTKVTVQMLSSVVMLAQVSNEPRRLLVSYLERLGRVRANDIVLYDATGGAPIYRSPPSGYKAGRAAPAWYADLVAPRLPPATIRLNGARLEVIPEPSRATLDAWDDLIHLLVLGGAFFVIVNLLVFWSVSRWLRPLATIQRALSAMEGGRLDVTLPDLRVPELARIGVSFNGMTRALRDAMSSNRRFALAVHQSSDAIVMQNPEGRISFVNPAAERMFGYDSDDLIGEPLRKIVPAARHEHLARALAAIDRREAVDDLVTRVVPSNGAEIDVALAAAPVVDPDGDRVVGSIVSFRNLSAQQRAQAIESELRRNRELAKVIEAERNAIARELHDELAQCVTAIRSMAEVISRRSATQADVRQAATGIKEVAGRLYDDMHAIVRRLRPVRLGVLGLSEAIRETVAAWRARNPATVYTLTLEGDLRDVGEAASVTAYRLVQEGMTNIVRHAHATHASVMLTLSREEGMLRVTIRDDGRGLVAPAAAAGYGLSGMRERIQALGGTLIVDGRPGEGTRIRAEIPVAVHPVGEVES